jgi:hypothetical protein
MLIIKRKPPPTNDGEDAREKRNSHTLGGLVHIYASMELS